MTRPHPPTRSPRRPGRRRATRTAAAGLALVTAGLLTAPPATPSADAQRSARLDLVAQTTWVGDDPAVIDLRVLGAPADARLDIRLHSPARRRSEFVDGLDGTPPGRIDGHWRIDDLGAASIGAGDVVSIVVPDDEIGELLRSRAGAHPLVIDLVAGDAVLDRLVTHLLVVRPDPEDVPLDVAVLAALGAPLGIEPDGTHRLDRDAVAVLHDRALVLAAHPDVPVTVDLRPETLTTARVVGDTTTLTDVADATAHAALVRRPWVDLDEAAWLLADGRDVVDEGYRRGAAALDEILDRSAGTVGILDGDAGPATVGLLADLGVDTVIVDPDRLSGLDPARVDGTVVRPFELGDGRGGGLGAVAADPALAEAITGDDAELAAHRVLAELLTIAVHQPTRTRGVVVDARGADPVALDLLLDGLRSASALRPVTVAEVASLPPARADGLDRDGPVLRPRLRPGAAPDLRLPLFDRRLTTARVDAFASLVESTGGLESVIDPLRERIAASDEAALDDRERSVYLTGVRDTVDASTAEVRIVDTGRVTLTAHRAPVPLTIANDHSLPLTVQIDLAADKLRFPEGDSRIVVLEPGLNELSVLVDAPGSGDARLRVTVRAPRGDLVLARGDVDIRSTALSGVGLIISVVALAVLAGWWIRSILGERRDRPAASVGGPAGDTGEPTGGTGEEDTP